MKKLSLTFAVALALSLPGLADDRIRDVQLELKAQGFYYGEVNGNNTAETGAAIRRFQIRNGLEVTGTLTDETAKSLADGNGDAPAPDAAPQQQAPPPVEQPIPQRKPPVNLRRDESVKESDRNFLDREETRQPAPTPQRAPGFQPPVEDEEVRRDPAPPPSEEEDPGAAPTARALEDLPPDLPDVFAGTPYANAPREVQWSTLRKAQSFLAGRGIYRDAIDGEPGPATEEALLAYQRSARIPMTGRLDLQTLSMMRLLPGRTTGAPLRGFIAPGERPSGPSRALKGIWVR